MKGASSLHRIAAITRHTVLQAIRMWIVLVAVAFLAALLLAMPFLLKSDNTHEGQARMVITYSLWLTTFLLSVLTLFLSSWVIWAEVKGRQILVLDPKPVGRGAILLGKWLAVMLINAALLVTMLGITYVLVRYYVGSRWRNEPAQAYTAFQASLFEARRVVRPDPPADLAERVEAEYQLLKQQNALPTTQSEAYVRRQITERIMRQAWAVAPSSEQEWIIRGLPKKQLGRDDWLMFRFTMFGPSERKLYDIPGRFVINPDGQPVVTIPEAPEPVDFFRVGRPYSAFIRATVVQDDGTLKVRFANYDRNGVEAQFPFMGGIEVQYPSGSLLENFARAGAIMLCYLAFLASVGIFGGTFLSYSVAALLSVVVYLVGMLQPYFFTVLPKLYLAGESAVPPWAEQHSFDEIIRQIVATGFKIFPNLLSIGDVIEAVANGSFIPTLNVAMEFFWVPFLRGGLLLFLGWLIFRRRQLAIFTPNA